MLPIQSCFSNALRVLVVTVVATSATACFDDGTADPPDTEDGTTTPIYKIQGNEYESPLIGQTVSIEGTVTGDFQDADADTQRNLGGFYLQEAHGDGDASTSDGIFIFDGEGPSVDVEVGDRVAVTGTVNEYFGETQISASAVVVTDTGSDPVKPLTVTLPAASIMTNSDDRPIADLERYEGMLVRFRGPLTVTELYNLETYGEIALVDGGRPIQFTDENPADVSAYSTYVEELASRRILLDDGSRSFRRAPIPYLFNVDGEPATIRMGDRVDRLTGNLRYSRGSGSSGMETYRLMPTTHPQFVAANPRPPAPEIDGSLKIAAFNVLNFFSTIDAGEKICGPDGNRSCRGADSVDERDRQLKKIVNALTTIDADIVALIELENNTRASLELIVDALNGATETGNYTFVDTGTIGSDTIKTGFIYKSVTALPQGAFAVLDSSVDTRFNDRRNRPALAQSFVQTSNGAVLTVVVTHLKSKGSSCENDGDPQLHDGQGNCNRTRTLAAAAIADWLQTDPTSSGDDDFLIIGDLNAYTREDPLIALENAGYTNLANLHQGSMNYSFVFDGQAGSLDHALASPSLSPQIRAMAKWHINADEARATDYNLDADRNPNLFDANTPYRASDHDPLIVGLNLRP